MNNQIIEEIKIRKLFNRMNYNLDLTDNGNISLLIAPNGGGKSTIFNFIAFLLDVNTPDYNYLKQEAYNSLVGIPFDTFEIKLNNGCSIRLKRTAIDKNPDYLKSFNNLDNRTKERINFLNSLEFSIIDEDGIVLDFDWSVLETNIALAHQENNEKLVSLFNSIIVKLKEEKVEKIEIKGENLLRKYYNSDNLDSIAFIDDCEKQLFWLMTTLSNNAGCAKMIHFISASRIGVTEYQKTIEEINRLLEAAYKTFNANKLYTNAVHKDYKEFKESWERLNLFQKEFSFIGLTTPEGIMDLVDEQSFLADQDKYERLLLSKYFNYYNFFQRDQLSTFFSFINDRFSSSEVELCAKEIDGKVMLMARNTYNRQHYFDVSKLSSGQKNDIVMFFKMIVINEYQIMLLDEPEVSQHIDVQEKLLDQLEAIGRHNFGKLQVIIATHSPHILNGHYSRLIDKEVWKND